MCEFNVFIKKNFLCIFAYNNKVNNKFHKGFVRNKPGHIFDQYKNEYPLLFMGKMLPE